VAGHTRDRKPAPALAHHKFSGVRPFFCQVEAVETAIWLTEVAPQSKAGKRFSTTSQRQPRRQPRADAPGAEARHRRRQDHVMAMLIAWQTVNAVRRPAASKFTRGFLIVRPGPDHQGPPARAAAQRPGQLLQDRELVPGDMLTTSSAPRSSSPTTTPSSCASASSCRRAAGSAPRARRRRAEHAGNRRPDAPAGDARPDGHEEHPRHQRRGAPLLPREAEGRGQTTKT
jgi:hypothetical protein